MLVSGFYVLLKILIQDGFPKVRHRPRSAKKLRIPAPGPVYLKTSTALSPVYEHRVARLRYARLIALMGLSVRR